MTRFVAVHNTGPGTRPTKAKAAGMSPVGETGHAPYEWSRYDPQETCAALDCCCAN